MQGWKKLTSDGSSMGLHGLAGCGGVVRNDNGQWVAGFSKWIGGPAVLLLSCGGSVSALSFAAT